MDARRHPESYRVGRGEQGVLTVEPYKSELLPLWRFRTPQLARESAAALTERFHAYLADGDIVGADMARKFLQMGFTRARRYANHPGGRKYDGPVPEGKQEVAVVGGKFSFDVTPGNADAGYVVRVSAGKATTELTLDGEYPYEYYGYGDGDHQVSTPRPARATQLKLSR